MPHLRFFIRNLCPRNFRKFRSKKIWDVPEILDQKKKPSIFSDFHVAWISHVAGLFVRQVGGPHGCRLFLVLNFRKFWTEILPDQPQKICRRVKTLALEAIGLGLDSRLPRTLPPLAHLPGGCLAISLTGYVATG